MKAKTSLAIGVAAGVTSFLTSHDFTTATAVAASAGLTAKFAYKALGVQDILNDLDSEIAFRGGMLNLTGNTHYIRDYVIANLKTGSAAALVGLAVHFGMESWQPPQKAQVAGSLAIAPAPLTLHQ